MNLVKLAEQTRLNIYVVKMSRILYLLICVLIVQGVLGQEEKKSYDFEGKISEEVLRNYLSRAVTMAEFCVKPEFSQDGYNPFKEDDFRFIENISVKFIGRAIFRWGNEDKLNNPEFMAYARETINRIHKIDQDVIFQACIFEVVTTIVNELPIPEHVFQAFDVEYQDRNFNYQAMLDESGKFVNHWGTDRSVPDITRMETQFWFYYLATLYIDAGFEAIHWGQVRLIGMNDQAHFFHFDKLFKMVREYAFANARRKFILSDAHTPNGGIVANQVLLFDFHSFPLRIKEIENKPLEGELEVGHLDALYTRSRGGMTASGWECEHLPYLVEFDNFGISDHPGIANITDHFVWGYDEISWFANQSDEYCREFLRYAHEWITRVDTNGFLQMPGGRKVTGQNNSLYRANTYSENCLIGRNLEETIIEIWAEDNQSKIKYFSVDNLEKFELYQNYPNPFNPITTIWYNLKDFADVTLSVYNIHGQHLKTLVQGRQAAGSHKMQWNATDEIGIKQASGIYFYKLCVQSQGKKFVKTYKMLLVR